MSRNITVFGIPNCDTVKKSRVWLQEQGLDFEFYDVKKQGLDQTTVRAWLAFVPLDLLINRKGTTWRALSDEQKALAADTESAIPLILSNPSLIKRPVLQMKNSDHMGHVSVGFSPDQFQKIFENK
ncbi:arsenate reductase [Undibacterium sp. Ji67W]|uniref:arsenate reductase n=1 Tax=Undibacterium sp. Ji67W TaxID=3413042 RepID=UPI003BF0C8D8